MNPEASHGSVTRYWQSCRCLPCRSARAGREAERRQGRIAQTIDATAAREHLLHLAAEGLGRDQVSRLTGVGDNIVAAIRSGRKTHARPSTIARILACPIVPAGHVPTTSWWTRKYIHALRQEGYSDATIAGWIGLTSLQRVFHVQRVRRTTAVQTERVYRSVTGEADSPFTSLPHFHTTAKDEVSL